jgi:hypothetical protein
MQLRQLPIGKFIPSACAGYQLRLETYIVKSEAV